MIIVTFFEKEKLKDYWYRKEDFLKIFPKSLNTHTKQDAYKAINDLTDSCLYVHDSYHISCNIGKDLKSVDLYCLDTWGDTAEKGNYLISFSLAEIPTLDVADFVLDWQN